MTTNVPDNEFFRHALSYARERTDKPFKHTFFSGEALFVGLNTLKPGQIQAVHVHEENDKIYFVLAGWGEFTVGEEVRTCGPGTLIIAPAGVPHGVKNSGSSPLTFLMVMSPPPGGRS